MASRVSTKQKGGVRTQRKSTARRPTPTKVLDTDALKRLCDRSEELRFSRLPNARFWADIDPNGTHVVAYWMLHSPNPAFWHGVPHPFDFSHNGGVNVRAVVWCKMRDTGEPCVFVFDFDQPQFESLTA